MSYLALKTRAANVSDLINEEWIVRELIKIQGGNIILDTVVQHVYFRISHVNSDGKLLWLVLCLQINLWHSSSMV